MSGAPAAVAGAGAGAADADAGAGAADADAGAGAADAFRAAVYGAYEAHASTEEPDAPASLRGRRLYVKGLPYGWGREAIRERMSRFGPVERLELRKGSRGAATVDFATPRAASACVVALDGSAPPGSRATVVVSVERVFAPPDDDGDGDSDSDGGGDACPVSFSGRGTRADERKARLVERRWKLRRTFCELCGGRDHFAQGCPLADPAYHARVAAGELDPAAAFAAADAPPPPPPPPAPAPPPEPARPALGRGRGSSLPAWMKDPGLAAKRAEFDEAAEARAAAAAADRGDPRDGGDRARGRSRDRSRDRDDGRRGGRDGRDDGRGRDRDRDRDRGRAGRDDGRGDGRGARRRSPSPRRRRSRSASPRRAPRAGGGGAGPRRGGRGFAGRARPDRPPSARERRRAAAAAAAGVDPAEAARREWRELLGDGLGGGAAAADAAAGPACWPMDGGLYAHLDPPRLLLCRALPSGEQLRVDATPPPPFDAGDLAPYRPEVCVDAPRARNAVLQRMVRAAPFALPRELRAALARGGRADPPAAAASIGELRGLLLEAADVDLPPLPPAVAVQWSLDHCCYFYYDAATGATSWERPEAP